MTFEARKPTAMGDDGLEPVFEPMERACSLLLPKGWTNRVHLQREHALNRIVASSVRPDGGAMFHVGDPRVPIFAVPGHVDPMVVGFNPHMRMQPYTPAPQFFLDYVGQCFGRAPGFRMLGPSPSPEFLRMASAILKRDPQAAYSAAVVAFEHAIEGRPMKCRLHGSTTRIMGMWMADFVIMSATEQPEALDGLAARIMNSRDFNAGWAAGQQQLHEHRMAMGRQQSQFIDSMTHMQQQGHMQRMSDIHAFGQANTRMHEQRMAQHDANHAAWMQAQAHSDAGQRAWMQGQAVDDAMQQSRVNAIREEHTAIDSAGNAYQVDIHHERYYVNRADNTYIGAGATTEREDLRRTHGVNPDDFEEVRIVR